MNALKVHSAQDAPQPTRAALEALSDAVGFVPNVYGLFAGSPAALQGLLALNAAFEGARFSPAEREVVALTTSVFNGCRYCVAGHSAFAIQHGVDERAVAAIRAGGAPTDARLRALAQTTLDILQTRGRLSPEQKRRFLSAGFEPVQFLELLLGVAGKVMTNFASSLTGLPLDKAFEPYAWTPTNPNETRALAQEGELS